MKKKMHMRSLRTIASGAVNRCLALLDLEVSRKDSSALRRRYLELIAEIESLCLEILPPVDLPARPSRREHIAGLLGTGVAEALHLVHYLHRALLVDGDVCEFGVAQGATSRLLADEMRHTDKTLWLFDSFKGLPRPTEKDLLIDDIFGLGSMDRYAGTMSCPREMVETKLSEIGFPKDRLSIVEGFIEEAVQHSVLPSKVCFAYVDFDFYEPILIALNLLDRCMIPGGYIVVDDYGFFSAGAQQAVDEFLEARVSRFQMVEVLKSAGAFVVLQRHDA